MVRLLASTRSISLTPEPLPENQQPRPKGRGIQLAVMSLRHKRWGF